MPSDCLYDYIGLRGLCVDADTEPIAFLNQLPGINLPGIDKVADSEQETYAGVWADVQLRGIRKLRRDFKAAFLGIYVKYCCSDECDLDELICDNKANLVDCLLYVFGVELMTERLYSDRINFITINKDETRELIDFYQVQYEDAIKLAVKSVPFDSIEDCFSCNGGRMYRETFLP